MRIKIYRERISIKKRQDKSINALKKNLNGKKKEENS
jgi:hypothetical protein